MPVNIELASKIWMRYAYCRDNGHTDFVKKADTCWRFVRGDQWTAEDKAALVAAKRPALTINKVLPTLSNVMGEQIRNRSEISFQPVAGAPAANAEVLAKVFKQISSNNHLDWKRSDMFGDGIATSRGYLDGRIEYNDQAQGEVRIVRLNPKNVVVDCDAEEYDPDTWSDVSVTKWLTVDDIEQLYGKENADLLRHRDGSSFEYGADAVEHFRDRFGDKFVAAYGTGFKDYQLRNLRVIDSQYRKLDRQKHFVSLEGDMRPIPEDFDRNKIARYVDEFGFKVVTKTVRRIRWTVVCDNVVLFDEWSPYKYFTVIPYFPYFLGGKTMGLCENLLGSQELLNKVSSQELHVVNTTANSGYKVKTGALHNMTPEQLEQKGAQTGIVIEVNGDIDDVEKIQPNQVPQGLDRISYKAEEHIKTISGVSDSMQGFDREDVAAKAIQAKRQAGSTNLVKPLDNLVRTDSLLARHVLDMVQTHYTEKRLLTITKSDITGESETFAINEPTPEGEVINDLTIGEYSVVVTSVPMRDSLEDSQFEQAMAMREAGVAIPDEVLIDASRLMKKQDIIKKIIGDQDSPEAQAQRMLQQRAQEAEVSKIEGEAAAKHADAEYKLAKAATEGNGPDSDPQLERDVADHEASLKERELERDTDIAYAELGLKRQKQDDDNARKEREMAEKREERRVEQARQAALAAQRPTKQGA